VKKKEKEIVRSKGHIVSVKNICRKMKKKIDSISDNDCQGEFRQRNVEELAQKI